jgi:hypothetical protein
MTSSYFRLLPGDSRGDMWNLNGLRDDTGHRFDERYFVRGMPFPSEQPLRLPSYPFGTTLTEVRPPLRVAMRRQGVRVDFSFADYGLPVVTQEVAEILNSSAKEDVQRLQVHVESSCENYAILNATAGMDCIDLDRSIIDWWPENNAPAHLVGQPRYIRDLKINEQLACGRHFFRPVGWEVALIVSEVVKRTLEDARVSGIVFEPM